MWANVQKSLQAEAVRVAVFRKIASDKKAAKNAKRNSKYIPSSAAASSQATPAVGGAVADGPEAMSQPNSGENY